MVIARMSDGEAGELLVIGVSRDDRDYLEEGAPVCLDGVSHGIAMPEGLQLVIFFGESNDSIRRELVAHGIVDPATEIQPKVAS